jgi:hypothetical protein
MIEAGMISKFGTIEFVSSMIESCAIERWVETFSMIEIVGAVETWAETSSMIEIVGAVETWAETSSMIETVGAVQRGVETTSMVESRTKRKSRLGETGQESEEHDGKYVGKHHHFVLTVIKGGNVGVCFVSMVHRLIL